MEEWSGGGVDGGVISECFLLFVCPVSSGSVQELRVCCVLQILTPIVILVTIVSAVSCSLFTNNNTQHVTLIIITLSSSLTTVDTGH